MSYDDLSSEAAQLRGTPWEHAKLSTEVVITGVLLGPSATDERALQVCVDKYCQRACEIGHLPLSPNVALALLARIAAPTLLHMAPFYHFTARQRKLIIRGAQRALHLPENGFSKITLQYLHCLVNINDYNPLHLVARRKFAAAGHLQEHISSCLAQLNCAAADSDYRALADLCENLHRRHRPCSWATQAIAHTTREGAFTVYELAPPEPTKCAEDLLRRFLLWAPQEISQHVSLLTFTYALELLSEAPLRDALGWLRMAQNALCTRRRFGILDKCLICHHESDRVAHIFLCEPVWAPLRLSLWKREQPLNVLDKLISPHAIRAWGLIHRAHASLRGVPTARWASVLRTAEL